MTFIKLLADNLYLNRKYFYSAYSFETNKKVNAKPY